MKAPSPGAGILVRVRIKIVVHRARLGAAEFRVIQPAEPLPRAALLDDDGWIQLYADSPSARVVGTLWLLAARSRRSLIHLPFRGKLPDTHEDAAVSRADLVLLHHSLQFRPSRWKELRNRLDAGRPQTAELPEADDIGPQHHDRALHNRENRDLFHEHVHAATVLLTGSAPLFRRTADRFFDVADNGPQGDGYRHYCAELHPSDGVLATARRFHVVYQDRWA